MKINKIMNISKRVQNGLDIALQEAIYGTDVNKGEVDISIDSNRNIIIAIKKEFDDEEYWDDDIIIQLSGDEFKVVKVWETPPFAKWSDGKVKYWESDVLETLNHYLSFAKPYFI